MNFAFKKSGDYVWKQIECDCTIGDLGDKLESFCVDKLKLVLGW